MYIFIEINNLLHIIFYLLVTVLSSQKVCQVCTKYKRRKLMNLIVLHCVTQSRTQSFSISDAHLLMLARRPFVYLSIRISGCQFQIKLFLLVARPSPPLLVAWPLKKKNFFCGFPTRRKGQTVHKQRNLDKCLCIG